jgi:hypothetical protein
MEKRASSLNASITTNFNAGSNHRSRVLATRQSSESLRLLSLPGRATLVSELLSSGLSLVTLNRILAQFRRSSPLKLSLEKSVLYFFVPKIFSVK